jgi:hypothetical protein
MVTKPKTAFVGRPPGPVSPRIAWYARYIWELPSIRYSAGGVRDTGASPIKWGFSISFRPMANRRIALARALRAILVVGTAAAWPAGCGSLTKQFEYEEDVTLSLDGSATIYLNASLAALVALRGADLDLHPNARFDAERIRAFFTSPVTRVGRVSSYRRHGRRYTYVRIDVDDIRRLSTARPFAWATYALDRSPTEAVFRQTVGAPANGEVGSVG